LDFAIASPRGPVAGRARALGLDMARQAQGAAWLMASLTSFSNPVHEAPAIFATSSRRVQGDAMGSLTRAAFAALLLAGLTAPAAAQQAPSMRYIPAHS